MKRVTYRPKPSTVAGLNSNAMSLLRVADGIPFDVATYSSDAVVAWLNGRESIERWAAAGSKWDRRDELIAEMKSSFPDGVPVEDCTQESRERILELLKVVRGTIASFKAAAITNKKPDGGWGWDRFQWMTALTRLMRKYATYPTLFLHPRTGTVGIAHQPTITNGEPWDKELMMQSLAMERSEIPYGEVLAAHGIIELGRLDLLGRVKQCLVEDCEVWFAGRPEKKYCCDAHRHKPFDMTEEAIKKRKERDEAKRKERDNKNYKAKRYEGAGAFDVGRKARKTSNTQKVG